MASATPAVKQFYKPGRRPRIPLSCDPCRTRKLKCNREKPCQNCTTRDEEATCRYKGSKNGAAPMTQQYDPMQQRINQLENLVKRLLAECHELSSHDVAHSEAGQLRTEIVPSPVTSDASEVAHNPSTTIIDSASIYNGTEDWYDVLQEINKLKNVWRQTQENQTNNFIPSTPSNIADGASLLFGQVKQIDKTEILATLPPKAEVDKLLCQFFDRNSFPITVAPILHEPTFMAEYAEHWANPSQTSVIWLGLLFSILGIVMLSYHQFDEPPEYEGISESLFQLYRLRTAQCLMIGDIAKCLPYTLETFRFNATAELNRREDNGRGLWIMTGVIVRVAINMGYHREPSRLSAISVLQAEYRRRVWFSVIGMDDVASFFVGFPRIMSSIYSDTVEPRNIHDWELSNDMTVLPPSRPLEEPTSATYLIVKGRLFRALGRITDFNNTPSLGSYDTVLEIDTALQEAYDNIPAHMKVYDGTGSVTPLKNKSDLSNFQLDSMYHQGLCILHRRFMAKGRLEPLYNTSRERCISSALALLKHQHILEPSWYKASQTRKMLTLAAMILFLELEYRRRGPDIDTSSDTGALLQALEKSCALWEDAKDSCDEALRVYQILVSMLSNFQNTGEMISSQTRTPESPLELLEMSPEFQVIDGSMFWDKDLFASTGEMDFDWSTWDTFIDPTLFENGSA